MYMLKLQLCCQAKSPSTSIVLYSHMIIMQQLMCVNVQSVFINDMPGNKIEARLRGIPKRYLLLLENLEKHFHWWGK